MEQGQASPLSLQEVLAETIDALKYLDTDRLEALERSVEDLRGSPRVENVTVSVTNLNILNRLLEETRKNLHVFKLLETRLFHPEDARGYAGILSLG
jgi:hypothetical protein